MSWGQRFPQPTGDDIPKTFYSQGLNLDCTGREQYTHRMYYLQAGQDDIGSLHPCLNFIDYEVRRLRLPDRTRESLYTE